MELLRGAAGVHVVAAGAEGLEQARQAIGELEAREAAGRSETQTPEDALISASLANLAKLM